MHLLSTEFSTLALLIPFARLSFSHVRAGPNSNFQGRKTLSSHLACDHLYVWRYGMSKVRSNSHLESSIA
jgi:hypothetical protein